ncbi:MAG: helix-turn-helix domain-containing protein [Patescibacteria group bacterium]|nr:helix-turn-helix domain-containing protein [Patescibacteria group bacterium]
MKLEKTLNKLGLSDKEARVYLAALELGPEAVQEIAKKSGVNRATTYVMIESLIRRGLMSSYEQGKKRLFAPEEPNRLFNSLKSAEQEIEERQSALKSIMPDLLAICAGAENKPRIRLFEGYEGIISIKQDIQESGTDYMDNILDMDEFKRIFSGHEFDEQNKKFFKSKLNYRCILTSGPLEQEILEKFKVFSGIRFLERGKFFFPGEIGMYANKSAFLTYRGTMIGVIIESAEINQMLRAMFSMLWEMNIGEKL